MRLYGTRYCIVCGKPTEMWTGHVKAVQYKEEKQETIIIATGFCSDECFRLVENKSVEGCFGDYNFDMGLMIIN